MRKNKKCVGCGIILQNDNILNIGYTPVFMGFYIFNVFVYM